MKGRPSIAIFFAIIPLLIPSFCGYAGNADISPKSSVGQKRIPRLNAEGRYTIRRGDSLIKIARVFETTPEALKSANGLKSSRIRVGQLLSIPGSNVSGQVETPVVSGTSAAGETSTSRAVQKPDVTGVADSETSPARVRLVKAGFELLGVRYRFSGNSEKSGFDCSGLVKNLFSKFDIDLPHSSREQFKQGKKVDRDELEPGDLVFFSSGGKQPNHVGIYVGDDKFLHAARKARRVIVSDLNKLWYAVRYIGARRVTDLWSDEQVAESQAR